MENHQFLWENPLFLWSFSIAMLNYQRVNMFKIIPCISADSLWMNQWERVENRQSPGRAKKDGDSVGLKQQKTGWWLQPPWKILVNGKDSPIYRYIMENKTCLKPPTRKWRELNMIKLAHNLKLQPMASPPDLNSMFRRGLSLKYLKYLSH